MTKKDKKPKDKNTVAEKQKERKKAFAKKGGRARPDYSPAHASPAKPSAEGETGVPARAPRVTETAAKNAEAEAKTGEKKTRKKFPWKLAVAVLAAVVVIGAILAVAFVTMNHGAVTIRSSKNTGSFPVSTTEDIKNVEVTKTGLFILSGTNLGCFRHNGDQINEFKLNFSSPRMKGSESFVLLYDSQGNGVNIYSGSALVRSHKSKDECQIVCAAMGKNGDYVIVTRPQMSSPFASCLTYYSSDGAEKFSWQCRDYIVFAEIADNSSHILVAAVNTELIDIYTELYVLPVKAFAAGDDSGLTEQRFDSAFVSASNFGRKGVVAILREHRVTFDAGNYEKTASVRNIKGTLTFSDTDDRGNTALITESNGRQVLFVYNADNELVYKKRISSTVEDIKIKGKKVWVLCPNKAVLITSAEKARTLAKFEIMQKGLAMRGNHIYNYSSNLLFSNL